MHKQIIEQAGGIIEEDIFVVKSGILIMAETQETQEAKKILKLTNTNSKVEFDYRLTYLTFPKEYNKEVSNKYVKKMTQEIEHLSVWGSYYVSFLLAGISIETSLELTAHTEARFSRITSSKTKCMNNPLFKVQGSPEEIKIQKDTIKEIIKLQNSQNRNITNDSNEFVNMLWPASKCTTITYTMSLKDFHRLFLGRLKEHGNETELKEICKQMCKMLHERYSQIIREVDYYKAV
jgi:thymidylate synthase ThyX